MLPIERQNVQACEATPSSAQHHHKKVLHNMLPIERQVQGQSVQVSGATPS